MRIKIKVGDSYLDTFNDLDDIFYITKQVFDIRYLQDRKSDFSRVFKIPNTSNNAAALDRLSNEQIGNSSKECLIEIDGINFAIAELIIVSDAITYFEITLLFGGFELFDLIPNESIKELDFSSENFAYTEANIATKNATTSGVILPAIQWLSYDDFDNGQGTPGQLTTYDEISNYGLGFHAKDILEKIFTSVGYTYTHLTGDDNYNDLALLFPVKIPVLTNPTIAANVDLSSDFNYDNTYLGLYTKVPFNNIVSDPNGLWSGATNYYYTISTGDSYTLIFSFNIDYVRVISGLPGLVRIMRDRGGTLTQLAITQLPNTGNYQNNLTAISTLQSGDKVYCEVSADYQNAVQYDSMTVKTGSYFDLKQNTEDPTGTLVVSDWLPDINQRDFLKSFLSIFNAVLDINNFDKTVALKLFNDIISDTAQDLTDNLDITNDLINEISINTYYKNSLMTYAPDDSIETSEKEYTAGFNLDAALPPFGTIISLIFGASDKGETLIGPSNEITTKDYTGNYNAVSGFSIGSGSNAFTFNAPQDFIPGDFINVPQGGSVNRIERIRTATTKKTGTFFNTWHRNESVVDVEILKFDQQTINPRMIVLDRASTNALLLTTNSYSSNVTSTSVNCYNGLLLSMPEIYETYYKNLFDALQTPKVITCWMVFDTVEFYNIDMLKPVYINQLNGHYYINKIEQWKLNAPCRVELIRINPLI